MADLELVYALDAGGEVKRVVSAITMQERLNTLLAKGNSSAKRSTVRDRVVGETGPLVCEHGSDMIFRQASVDGRKPHFAHAKRQASGELKHTPDAVCACSGRGGRGQTHILAQKLIAENIASIKFMYWCRRNMHQNMIYKDPGFTAKLEKTTCNGSGARVHLDVAVYKDERFVFAVEVTHTHRVSSASREGISYVDVNAEAAVRALESGEGSVLCEKANNVNACAQCQRRFALQWFAALDSAWTSRVRDAFRKLHKDARGKRRRERQREDEERRCMAEEQRRVEELRNQKRQRLERYRAHIYRGRTRRVFRVLRINMLAQKLQKKTRTKRVFGVMWAHARARKLQKKAFAALSAHTRECRVKKQQRANNQMYWTRLEREQRLRERLLYEQEEAEEARQRRKRVLSRSVTRWKAARHAHTRFAFAKLFFHARRQRQREWAFRRRKEREEREGRTRQAEEEEENDRAKRRRKV